MIILCILVHIIYFFNNSFIAHNITFLIIISDHMFKWTFRGFSDAAIIWSPVKYVKQNHTRCPYPKTFLERLSGDIYLMNPKCQWEECTKPKQGIITGSKTVTSLRGHTLAYESVVLTAQECNIYSAVYGASVLSAPQIPSTHAGKTHGAETMSHDLYCKKCLPWVAAWTLQWAMVWRWPLLLGNRSAGSLTIQ